MKWVRILTSALLVFAWEGARATAPADDRVEPPAAQRGKTPDIGGAMLREVTDSHVLEWTRVSAAVTSSGAASWT